MGSVGRVPVNASSNGRRGGKRDAVPSRRMLQGRVVVVVTAAAVLASMLAARGAAPSAFERRCIPAPPQRASRVGDAGAGGVAPPSNIPDIATPPRKPRASGAPALGRRALPGVPSVAATVRAPAGRLAALGATMELHHGLPARL